MNFNTFYLKKKGCDIISYLQVNQTRLNLYTYFSICMLTSLEWCFPSCFALLLLNEAETYTSLDHSIPNLIQVPDDLNVNKYLQVVNNVVSPINEDLNIQITAGKITRGMQRIPPSNFQSAVKNFRLHIFYTFVVLFTGTIYLQIYVETCTYLTYRTCYSWLSKPEVQNLFTYNVVSQWIYGMYNYNFLFD